MFQILVMQPKILCFFFSEIHMDVNYSTICSNCIYLKSIGAYLLDQMTYEHGLHQGASNEKYEFFFSCSFQLGHKFLIAINSIFGLSPSLRAEITKLVTINGDSHLGTNCQCEQRAIAVSQMVATAFASPADKKEAGHCRGRLFSIIESDVVSK